MTPSIQIQHVTALTLLLVLVSAWPLKTISAATTSIASNQRFEQLPAKTNTQPDKQTNRPSAISFDKVDEFPQLLSSGQLAIENIPNPHWNKNGCIACHKTTAGKAAANNLRHKPVQKSCNNCHSAAFDHSYIHPSDVKPEKKMLAHMAPEMKALLEKNNNMINCSTCHDLIQQCLPDTKKQQLTNPKFFRSGPYKSRSQLCFLCHDKDQYQLLNPHDQINQQGQLRTEKCSVCHADSVKALNKITTIEQLKFHNEESLSAMCWGCHPWVPHPGGQFSFFKQSSGPNHLLKPSELTQKTLDEMTKKNNIDFPLEPKTGKLFCGTCHNPHEKGVINNPANAKGADSKKRLRAQEICQYCHLI